MDAARFEDEVLALVETHLVAALGEPRGRAAVTFLGADRIEVLRFVTDDPSVVRYVTLGMSRRPMHDPLAAVADPLRGPRAELVLSLHDVEDEVLRPLAVFAASPQVEGVVVAPGGALELGGPPLWPGAPFGSVLVGEPGGVVPDLELPAPAEPVRWHPLLPMTPNEAAYKRVHGAAALEELWLRHRTDLRDPARGTVPLAD
ncbi:Suppressor of fused domain protein [Wenjunlia vitaminophila]|uniref:Suppressor of fused domain protein n=1 Tax=Wenjunlia vitaminophila TaxID=76728 RepID=A0A0T6LLX9_WENVI|nr:suppressor of fused domain protein [Wenjunlia vitaminophila]KRV47086.1 Suppressor of fused domain protein [Wenjunlia vitaminophila]